MDRLGHAVRLSSVLEIEVEIEREKRMVRQIARPEMIGVEYILHNLVYYKYLIFSPFNVFLLLHL